MGEAEITGHSFLMAGKTMVEQQLPFVDEDDPNDWRTLDDRVSEIEEQGDVMDAKKVAATAVSAAREAENGNNDNTGQLLHCLEVRANLFNRQGDFASAQADYFEAISLVAGESGQEGTVGRLYGNLGYLFESTGEDDKAVDAYERALEQLGRLRKPPVVEEVRLMNNVAFIYSARDEFEEAEMLFLKALKVAHDKLGESSPDTTGVFNNIGALYQKAEHFEQAQEMHQMALDGRIEDGSSSGDIGQSHGNLAIVFAELGDEKEARENFESALTRFQDAGLEFSEDFEAVCENYLHLLRNVGDIESQERVRTLLEAGLT